jgi:hypothetical protein
MQSLELENKLDELIAEALDYVTKAGISDGVDGISLEEGKNRVKKFLDAKFNEFKVEGRTFFEDCLVPNSQKMYEFIQYFSAQTLDIDSTPASQLKALEGPIQAIKEYTTARIEEEKKGLASEQAMSKEHDERALKIRTLLKGVPCKKGWRTLIYTIIIIMFASADIAINYKTIELIGEMAPIFSLLTSIAISSLFAVSAHFAGEGLKKGEKTKARIAIAIAILGFIALFYGRWTKGGDLFLTIFNALFYSISCIAAYTYCLTQEAKEKFETYYSCIETIKKAKRKRQQHFKKIKSLRDREYKEISNLEKTKDAPKWRARFNQDTTVVPTTISVKEAEHWCNVIQTYATGFEKRIDKAQETVIAKYDVYHQEGAIQKGHRNNPK